MLSGRMVDEWGPGYGVHDNKRTMNYISEKRAAEMAERKFRAEEVAADMKREHYANNMRRLQKEIFEEKKQEKRRRLGATGGVETSMTTGEGEYVRNNYMTGEGSSGYGNSDSEKVYVPLRRLSSSSSTTTSGTTEKKKQALSIDSYPTGLTAQGVRATLAVVYKANLNGESEGNKPNFEILGAV
jgi:hypothetical protein